MAEIEKMKNPLEQCLCGTCESCLAAIKRASEITFKMEGRARLRLAERFSENLMKRAVMDAQDHCLIIQNMPTETWDYYIAYWEFCLSLTHEAVKTMQIKARKNVANDPKSIAEFKAALAVRREGKGKKAKKEKTEALSTPKETKVGVQKYKATSNEEAAIIKALFAIGDKPEVLKMALPMIIASNKNIDVMAIARKMGIKVE